MLLLASQSTTRNALLSAAGVRFAASPSRIDERVLEAASLWRGPEAIAAGLAAAKALDVSARHPGAVAIGADQVLNLDGSRLDKPAGLQEARAQLDALSGRQHRLVSAVALVRDGAVLWSTTDTARLTMRRFATTERDEVLALEGEGILGCVGAYRLEGPSIRLFERIEGDYFTILGLPLLPLLGALRLHAPDAF